MSHRRYIVVDPITMGPREVDSLDGTEGCPVPLLGRCLTECYYTLRPSKRPPDYHIDPTVFVEPVWYDTCPTDVQADEEAVTDTSVESRPLRLVSTAFSNISTPPVSVQRIQTSDVEMDDIEWFTTKKPDQEEFMRVTKQRTGKIDRPVSEHLERMRQKERSRDSAYTRRKESVAETNESAARQVLSNRIVRRATRLPDTWETTENKQQLITKAVSQHQYEWFRSTLGWITS
ncbi:uncharacterized protein LOC110466853 [Mizuhopecten yessoensis]|nr:uncharacterized protein LOC110466853 [Mizuhopecten yessoensis]